MNQPLNRRAFFKSFVKLAGLVVVTPTVIQSVFTSAAMADQKRPARPGTTPAAGGALPMVDTNDSTAKAVKYVEDNTKALDAKGNHCGTCGFYAKKENRNGKEVGTCTIFQGKLVYSGGYCSSWNKKA